MDDSVHRSMQAKNPLKTGRELQQFTHTQPQHPSHKASKRSKPRWHFGIRSRSPPMEVMLEIYRTLQTLGFEWRKKEEPHDPQPPASAGSAAGTSSEETEEDPRRRRRREEEDRIKKEQGLFFVETRCRLGDVVVTLCSPILDIYACLIPHASGLHGHSAVSSRFERQLFGRLSQCGLQHFAPLEPAFREWLRAWILHAATRHR